MSPGANSVLYLYVGSKMSYTLYVRSIKKCLIQSVQHTFGPGGHKLRSGNYTLNVLPAGVRSTPRSFSARSSMRFTQARKLSISHCSLRCNACWPFSCLGREQDPGADAHRGCAQRFQVSEAIYPRLPYTEFNSHAYAARCCCQQGRT